VIDDDPRPKIYVSSKPKYADMWKQYIIRGHRLISSWIHLEGEIEIADIGHMWPTWLEEASSAAYLIFYAGRDDPQHSGNLLEIGACISHGGIILHVGESSSMKTGNGKLSDFTYMPQWQRISTLDKAFQMTVDGVL
jgi:hypothetical protein